MFNFSGVYVCYCLSKKLIVVFSPITVTSISNFISSIFSVSSRLMRLFSLAILVYLKNFCVPINGSNWYFFVLFFSMDKSQASLVASFVILNWRVWFLSKEHCSSYSSSLKMMRWLKIDSYSIKSEGVILISSIIQILFFTFF